MKFSTGQQHPTVTEQRNISILGGGLTGLLLALMLARRGLRVSVYDRGADPRDGQTGAGRSINLALAERGRHALKHADLLAAVMPLTTPMTGRAIHAADGSFNFQPYGQYRGEQIYSVSRHDLTVALAENAATAGVSLHFGERCTAIDIERGSAELTRADGSQHRIALAPVIAADGAGSIVRRTLDAKAGFGAHEALLDHGYKELSIPATAYGWYRQSPYALHIWPRGGHMLIALPNLTADFTATLFLPKEGEHGFEALEDVAAAAQFFETNYPNALAVMPDFHDDYGRNPVGIMGTVRCQRWHYQGEVLLVGDAAHAIVPFHGQGMNAAFEDCVVLDRLVADLGTDWATVFARFEQARRENTNAIADMALENYIEMRDSVRDATFHLRKALAFELEQRLPQQFIPRYSMVMFHPEIGYADAQRRGETQAALLAEFTERADNLGDIDIDAAVAAAAAALSPV